MQIEAKGVPPYKVSSGPPLSNIDVEHFADAENFKEAYAILFDLCNGGLNPNGEHIIDSKEEVVFTVDCETDLDLLRATDKFGLFNVEFI
jgi:hypothetical protein